MNADEEIRRIKTFRGHKDFRQLPDQALHHLASMAHRMQFTKGQFIFHSGDLPDFCHFVETGRIVLSKDSPSGKSFTFLVAERGMTLNSVTCFKPIPRFFTARAIEKSSLLGIPSEDFKNWALQRPDLTNAIISTMGELLDDAYNRIIDLVDASVEQRIINTLAKLSSRMGPTLPFTNNDLADMTGTSRETAARVIGHLQGSGLLLKSRGKIKIADVSKFEHLSTSATLPL
jgi:CRP-like cAMP-binding protein